MFSHLNGYSDDPFKRLKESIRIRFKEDRIEDQIFGVVQHAFSEVLKTDNIVLSRVERNRLLREILKDTLDDMLLAISGKG
jgi:hypothetical protein